MSERATCPYLDLVNSGDSCEGDPFLNESLDPSSGNNSLFYTAVAPFKDVVSVFIRPHGEV
jgi:hypothetical protein